MSRTTPLFSASPPSATKRSRLWAEVLRSGRVAGQGPVGSEVRGAFARLTDTAGALAVNNRTAALHPAFHDAGSRTR